MEFVNYLTILGRSLTNQYEIISVGFSIDFSRAQKFSRALACFARSNILH